MGLWVADFMLAVFYVTLASVDIFQTNHMLLYRLHLSGHNKQAGHLHEIDVVLSMLAIYADCHAGYLLLHF